MWKDRNVWGSRFAIRNAQVGNKYFWHSDSKDKNPWIMLQILDGSREVVYVVVQDRTDRKWKRYQNVEVKVSDNQLKSWNGGKSCGKQSYKNNNKFRYK